MAVTNDGLCCTNTSAFTGVPVSGTNRIPQSVKKVFSLQDPIFETTSIVEKKTAK